MRFFRIRAFCLAVLAATPLANAAPASVVYSNGPFNAPFDGQDAAAPLFGQAVADSFVLSARTLVTRVNFLEWAGPGENPISVDWAILDGVPGTGTVLAMGTAATDNTFLYLNSQFFGVYLASFVPIFDLTLDAGTYWLELQNAQVTDFGVGFWDINGGPSQAWTSTAGDVTTCTAHPSGRCSNSFEIVGVVPEPSSLALMATILLLGAGCVRTSASRARV